MIKYHHIFSASLLLAISACGGGGSSSGSSGFSGIYDGGGNHTFTIGSLLIRSWKDETTNRGFAE